MQRHLRASTDRYIKNGLYLAGAGTLVVWFTVLSPFKFSHRNPSLPKPPVSAALLTAESLSAAVSTNAEIEASAPIHPPASTEPLLSETEAAQLLIAAAEEGNETRVDALLKRGVDINATDAEGRTALLAAAEKGRLPVVRTLIAAGADVNLPSGERRTPLIAATITGGSEIMAELINHGANLDAADATGHGAIHHAIMTRNLEAIRLLLAKGADCTRDCCDGKNALAHAFETFDYKIAKTVLDTLPGVMNWNSVTREALYGAIRGRDREIAHLLLAKHRTQPTLEGTRQPLLAYTIAWQDLDQLKFLLECGADPNAELGFPAEKQFVGLFQGQMLPHYLTTEPGMTPLMLASAMGRSDIVEILLSHGAKRGMVTDKYKLVALNFAAWVSDAPTLLVLLGKSPRLEDQEMRVEISLRDQRAYFYKNGQIALTSQVSTGKPGHATPTGTFVITDKHPSHKSTIYKVDMPFFMRLNCREFGMHQGIVPNYPASHGCIRMPGDKARELYKQVDIGTLVTIAD